MVVAIEESIFVFARATLLALLPEMPLSFGRLASDVLRRSSGRDLNDEMTFASLKLIAYSTAVLLLTGCAGLPVKGTVGGQAIQTQVDSEVARYYVANYLAGKD